MRRHTRRFLVGAVASAMLLLGSCSNAEDNGRNASGDEPLDEVTYLTGFGVLGRESFAWVALDKGYFEEEGIAVTIQAGTGTGDNIALVTSGQAQFAHGDSTGAMLLYGEGASQEFTTVAAVHQRTISGILTLEGEEIDSPTDLEGKTIGDIIPSSVNYALFETYARLAGIDPEKVNWENAPPPELPQLLAQGRVDAIGQYMVGEPLVSAAAGGRKVISLPYSDYLTDLYGGVIVTSKQLAEDDPDLVRRFVRALMRGLEYTADHPQEAAEILAKYEPDVNVEVAAAEAELLANYVRPLSPGEPFGIITEERVAQSIAVLEAAGAIPAGITPEDLVRFDLVPAAE